MNGVAAATGLSATAAPHTPAITIALMLDRLDIDIDVTFLPSCTSQCSTGAAHPAVPTSYLTTELIDG
jgi:hypothetical protein